MSYLRIFLPEAGFGASCDWALHHAGTVNTGTSACDALPPADQIILIVAASRVLLTHVKLPTAGQGKLREMLSFAVEDKLLAEPEKIHAVAATRDPDGMTTVAVIDKAWLRQQLAQLQQYGIRPDKMLAETLLLRLEANAWSMVWHGQGGFVRSAANAGFVVDGGDADTPPMALELALTEASAADAAPARILLYRAEGTPAPTWSDRFNIEARGVWSWQTADSGAAASLNLLQGEFAPARKGQAEFKQFRPALMLLGLILMLHLLFTLADWMRLRHEQNRLQDEMVATFKQTFPEAAAIVDPALQMRRNVSALRHARGATDGSDFLPLLAVAAPVMRQGKIQALQYEQGLLRFDLLLPDEAQLESLREQLRALPLSAEFSAPSALPAGLKVQLALGMGQVPRQERQ